MFSSQKETYFDRWSLSNEVGFDYNKLRQMIVTEEFKECIPEFVKTYLDEKWVNNVNEMAVLADDYVLTHKCRRHKPGN